MSKYIRALQKAEELRSIPTPAATAGNPQPQPAEAKPRAGTNIKRGANAFAVLIVIAGAVALYANIKAYLQFKYAHEVSAQSIFEQEQKIDSLELQVVKLNDQKESQWTEMSKKVEKLDSSIEEKENQIANIEIDNSLLRLQVKEIANTNEALMTKYIELVNKLDDLEQQSAGVVEGNNLSLLGVK